jgi:hypothetical protein
MFEHQRQIIIKNREGDETTGGLLLAVYDDEEGEIQIVVEATPGGDAHEIGHFLGAIVAAVAEGTGLSLLGLYEGATCALKNRLRLEIAPDTKTL